MEFLSDRFDVTIQIDVVAFNVLVDARVAEMVSKTAISEEFCNTPVDTAVRLLTDKVMSHGVQLPDLFDALPADEAHRQFSARAGNDASAVLKAVEG